MSTQLRTLISAKIKALYDFHEYQVSKENIVKITELVFDIKPDTDVEYFDRFLKEVYTGYFGVLYKMPTCLLSMFRKYVDENTLRLKM